MAVHKGQHKIQIYPGKDKCGKRNCLIVKTIEKCVRVRAGNITSALMNRLLGGSRKTYRGTTSSRDEWRLSPLSRGAGEQSSMTESGRGYFPKICSCIFDALEELGLP